MEEVPIWEKANLTIKEAAAYSNIGVKRLYELINNPRCDFVIYVGRKKLIKKKKFDEYMEKIIEI